MTLDSDVHKAFSDFYADSDGVRGRYLKLFGRLAEHFAKHPAVLGYDLINEPWGWETSEIGPLYEAVAKVIRAAHPKAILFIEGHLTTNGGAIQTLLDKPKFDNFAYAPHFYDAAMLASHAWSGLSTVTDFAFQNMRAKAKQWNVPLFIGEFGADANTIGGAAYMDLQYRRLDETFASAAQWNYTPGWTPENKDGWNDEDLSVVDSKGMLRANYRIRPYPSRIAGQPKAFVETADLVSLTWQHRPAAGVTTVFVPVDDLWPGNDPTTETKGDGLGCQFDNMSRYVTCTSQTEAEMKVTIRKKN
jgi:endoglycosylceramidase